jgi:hypothetical protein
MYNPRWPHTFTVMAESLDENGLPVTDASGKPVVGCMHVRRILYDPQWNPRRNSDGSFQTECITEVPWGYRTSTGGMKTSGEVWVADYKISTPMLLTDLPSGTILRMTDYTHTFRVKVVKATTYNWGTDLWVDNIKN